MRERSNICTLPPGARALSALSLPITGSFRFLLRDASVASGVEWINGPLPVHPLKDLFPAIMKKTRLLRAFSPALARLAGQREASGSQRSNHRWEQNPQEEGHHRCDNRKVWRPSRVSSGAGLPRNGHEFSKVSIHSTLSDG